MNIGLITAGLAVELVSGKVAILLFKKGHQVDFRTSFSGCQKIAAVQLEIPEVGLHS